MEFEFLSINFYEMFMTVLSVVMLGIISICLFFWFKNSSDKIDEHMLSNGSSNSKKKSKRKLNLVKTPKSLTNDDDLPIEKSLKSRHIEINSSPEILEDSNKEIKIVLGSCPTKPILRKGDNEIFVDEEGFHENTWAKVPKDEIEIRRSRQSSVVSESRSIPKEELAESATKLSRGQKKRLKAKLKGLEVKPINDGKDVQFNNSAICTLPNNEISDSAENVNVSTKSTLSKGVKKRLNKKQKNYLANSSELGVGNDKEICFFSYSQIDYNDKNQYDSSVEDFKEDETGSSDMIKTDEVNCVSFVNTNIDSELQLKCHKYELENKELKSEIISLKQKLNEFSSMSTTAIGLKKDNEMYIKKHAEIERTCAAIQKELTNSLQKTNSAENRLHRLTTERNQEISYYDNEINKYNAKISMLEADIRSKTTDNDNFKMNMEKLRHIISDKDQLIQSQNNEMSIMKDQIYKKRVEFQEIEGISKKYKELEIQNQKLLEDNQKIKFQNELNNSERKKDFEKFKIETKNKEREQNSVISSLQYQLDEFQKEKQFSMINQDFEDIKEENEKLKKLYEELKNKSNNPTVPDGYELIESDKLKELASKITDGNKKLQEKCEQYNFIKNQMKENENRYLENNLLENKFCQLNSEREENLKEIVNLRQSIETLQLELTKNSDNNLDEMRIELDKRSEALRKTEEILKKLQSSVEEEELRWKDSLKEKLIANEKLENENKQQTFMINNLNKKVSELTLLLQSTNCQNDSQLNGSLSVE